MVSCRVVGLLLLALLTTIEAGAQRELSEDDLKHNVLAWMQLQHLVNAENKANKKPDSFVNPFNMTGFISLDKKDGSAVLLAARNIVPDLNTTRLFFPSARGSTPDPCEHFPPPERYEREAVPLITIAVIFNWTQPGRPDAFYPFICAMRRHTALMIFLDISRSLVYPPLGDLCNTMILIRQALHSARFFATIFSQSTTERKMPLCRPIVWGNLSPYLQIRRVIPHSNEETLLFLGSKGGTINFSLDDDLHYLHPHHKDHRKMSPINEVKKKRMLANLYATFDNTCQLAFRSRRIGENKMTGPRFAFPSVENLKAKYLSKRKELSVYIEEEGQDLSHINMLQIIPVLLFAGTITMFIAINPQYVTNDYERIVEVVEDETHEGKTTEKKFGVLDAIKNIVSDPMNASHGRRVKKKKSKSVDKTNEQTKTMAEVTAEGDLTITARTTEKAAKKDDKNSKKKKNSDRKGGATSANKKKPQKKQDKTAMSSDNEMTADGTVGTTAGTEVTAGATLTAPGSS